jgi:hypothetical protein
MHKKILIFDKFHLQLIVAVQYIRLINRYPLGEIYELRSNHIKIC